jgi:hypothetical protein
MPLAFRDRVVLITNGVICFCYLFARRRMAPTFLSSWPRCRTANAARQFAYYIRILNLRCPRVFQRPSAPEPQRGPATRSRDWLWGLTIHKPVQFHVVTLFFGDYDSARVVHLASFVCLGSLA